MHALTKKGEDEQTSRERAMPHTHTTLFATKITMETMTRSRTPHPRAVVYAPVLPKPFLSRPLLGCKRILPPVS